MELPNICRQNRGRALSGIKGFTLIEILLTLGLLAVIFGFGLFVSFDFYKSFSLRSERSVIVSILQKARSESMNNINQARHGVHFASPLQYVIFECTPGVACIDYTGANTSENLSIAPNSGVAVTGSDIVFDQLSGNCDNPGTITVTANGTTQTISVNSQGRIDW